MNLYKLTTFEDPPEALRAGISFSLVTLWHWKVKIKRLSFIALLVCLFIHIIIYLLIVH